MADNSKIQWTTSTWNPITGCTKVSEGCDRCYIARTPPFRMAGRRFDKPGVGGTTGVTLHEDRLSLPLRWRKPRRIFPNSLSDLFHDQVPDEYIARTFAVMAATPQHTYQPLTKRPGRMRSLLRDECRCGAGHTPGVHFRSAMEWAATPHSPTYVPGLTSGLYHRLTWPLPNLWLGVSVENQHWADVRIPALLDTPAAVRWISAEPLLGPVDLHNCRGVDAIEQDWVGGESVGSGAPHPFLDWVVCGGESGPAARPMDLGWVRSLRDQCADAGVPLFVKQLGSVWARATCGAGVPVARTDPSGGDWDHWPSDLRVRQFPAGGGPSA